MITIVSGLPGSGQALMMRVLQKGGMVAHSAENQDQASSGTKNWLADAEGKVCSLESSRLTHLPASHEYRIIFMLRDIDDVIAVPETLPAGAPYRDEMPPEIVRNRYEVHLLRIKRLLDGPRRLATFYCEYTELIDQPLIIVRQLEEFMGMRMDTRSMAVEAGHAQYRNHPVNKEIDAMTQTPSPPPTESSSRDLMTAAFAKQTVIPAFNIPYLPMMQPVIDALRDTGALGFVTVARLEWIKFESRGTAAVREAYAACGDRRFSRLHLDHIPVIDEDGKRVEYREIIAEALDLGYDSVMIDGSRLPLAENIAVTREISRMAHDAGRPVEAELGAVLGHEAGPLPPYDELWRSGRGFTDPDEAKRFVDETGVDWLSVSIGNIHGAISGAARHQEKIQARLNIERLQTIRDALGGRTPLVLHGGSGIPRASVMQGIRNGIAKINVATTLRQAYERQIGNSAKAARQAVYEATRDVILHELDIAGSADLLQN